MSPVRTRAGTAGSACRSTCGRETSDSGDRRALRLGQPALPAAPARRRPPRRLSVGQLKACCLPRRPAEVTPAQQVEVDVEDRLPGGLAVVGDDAVAVA